MKVIRFDLKTLIIFGTGSIKELGEEAAKLGHKAMIITYPDIRRIGLLDTVVRDLRGKNIEVIVFDKIEPNPRTTTVDEGAEIARKENINLVIGLGGGSVMDAAKGIALACGCDGPVTRMIFVLQRIELLLIMATPSRDGRVAGDYA